MTPPSTPPPPVDPSTIAAVRGVFAAVTDEREATDLTVEGELPEGLAGAYLRNGPNPLYRVPSGLHGNWFPSS